jgi:chemotaxis protein MotD
MSALAFTILNGLAAGARAAANFPGAPNRDTSAGEAFDATLAESAVDATKDGADKSGPATPSVPRSLRGEAAPPGNGAASDAQAQGGDVISQILNLASEAGGGAATASGGARWGGAQGRAFAASPLLAEKHAKASTETMPAATGDNADQAAGGRAPEAAEPRSSGGHSMLDHATIGATGSERRKSDNTPRVSGSELSSEHALPESGTNASTEAAKPPEGGAIDKKAAPSGSAIDANPLPATPSPTDPAVAAAMAATQPLSPGAAFGAGPSSGIPATPGRGGWSSQPEEVGKAGRTSSARSATGSAADPGVPPLNPQTTGATTNVQVVDMKTWHAPVAEAASAAREISARTASATATAGTRNETRLGAPESVASPQVSPSAAGQSSFGTVAAPVAPIVENSAARAGTGTPAGASLAAPSAPAANISTAPRRDIEVTLQPNELGGVSLRMKSVGDRLELTIVAEKGDTARMIDERRTRLESQLRDAGLGSGGVDISVAVKPNGGIAANAPAAGGSSSDISTGGGRADDQARPSRQAPPERNLETASDDSSEMARDAQRLRADRDLYL